MKKIFGDWRHRVYRSSIVRYLVSRGFDVTIIDNNQRGSINRLRDLKNKN